MPLLNLTIDSIAAAALVYFLVGLTLHLHARFVMPKRQASPGLPAAPVVDPWSLPLEPIAAPTIPAAVVPMFTTPPYLMLLPAAQTDPIALDSIAPHPVAVIAPLTATHPPRLLLSVALQCKG